MKSRRPFDMLHRGRGTSILYDAAMQPRCNVDATAASALETIVGFPGNISDLASGLIIFLQRRRDRNPYCLAPTQAEFDPAPATAKSQSVGRLLSNTSRSVPPTR